MKPEIWGPHAWIFLHSITLDYPDCPSEDHKNNMRSFINSLSNILPCQKCRLNFGLHIQKYPLTDKILCSKKELVKWMIDIHNSVNQTNNKPIQTYEESLREILNLYEGKSDYRNYIFCLLFTLLFIIIFVVSFQIFSQK